MPDLTEIKGKNHHFYGDEEGRFQGVSKEWYDNGQLLDHCIYKDHNLHGEAKLWHEDGEIDDHSFLQNGIDITNQVKELVEDIKNITNEEKLIIKIKFGIECLC